MLTMLKIMMNVHNNHKMGTSSGLMLMMMSSSTNENENRLRHQRSREVAPATILGWRSPPSKDPVDPDPDPVSVSYFKIW